MRQFAAIRRSLRQIVRFFRSWVLWLYVSDPLMCRPVWERIVGLPAYRVEGNAAMRRQRVKGTLNVFQRNPFPKRKHAAFYNGRSCVSAPSVVCLCNQANPKPKLKIRKSRDFIACKCALFNNPVRHSRLRHFPIRRPHRRCGRSAWQGRADCRPCTARR